MKRIPFDRVFKVTVLILVAFFVFFFYRTNDKSGVGRFQVIQFKERYVVVIDTKTGEVKMVTPKP